MSDDVTLSRRHTPAEQELLREINSGLPQGVDWRQGAIAYEAEHARRKGAAGIHFHQLKPIVPDLACFCDHMWRFVDVIDKLRVPERATILDVGCGPGWTTHLLAKLGYDVIGIDICEDLLAYAGRRFASDPFPPYPGEPLRFELRVHDIEHDPLALPKPADAALFESTLHHFFDPIAVLENVRGCLKEGGVIAILEGRPPGPGSEGEQLMQRQMRDYRTLERPLTRSQIERLLTLTGFPHYDFYVPINGFFEMNAIASRWAHDRILDDNASGCVIASPSPEPLRRIRERSGFQIPSEGPIDFLRGFSFSERNERMSFRWCEPRGALGLHGVDALRLELGSYLLPEAGGRQRIRFSAGGTLLSELTLDASCPEATVSIAGLTAVSLLELESDRVFFPSWDGLSDRRMLSFTVRILEATRSAGDAR